MPRILAIDPSLRCTGFAILEAEPRETTLLASGLIKNKQSLTQSGCLVAIREAIKDAIEVYKPESCAVESVIYVQSFKTAIVLGAARGAAICTAAEYGLPVYEYAPKRAKQAVVGRGSADKAQVAFMIRALLKLTETPPSDIADACAIGLAHIQAATSPKGLENPI